MTVLDGEYVKLVVEVLMPDNVIAQNVWYFIADFAATQLDADVLDALKDWAEYYLNELVAQIPDDVTIRNCKASKMQWNATEGFWEVVRDLGSDTPDVTFTGTDDPFPNAVAPTLYFPTSRPRSRGRKALFTFIENMIDDNDLSTTAVTAIANAIAEILTEASIDVNNFLTPGILRRGVNSFLPFSSGAGNTIVGSMRSRKPGEGT